MFFFLLSEATVVEAVGLCTKLARTTCSECLKSWAWLTFSYNFCRWVLVLESPVCPINDGRSGGHQNSTRRVKESSGPIQAAKPSCLPVARILPSENHGRSAVSYLCEEWSMRTFWLHSLFSTCNIMWPWVFKKKKIIYLPLWPRLIKSCLSICPYSWGSVSN